MRAQERIPSLDGVRCLAIMIVLVGHCAIRFSDNLKHFGIIWQMAGSGTVGVDVFFVLSGYLITTLLLREFDQQGHIELGRFYQRRAFRILPAFYVYLIAVVLLGPVLGWKIPLRTMALSAAFLTDYAVLPHPWLIAHTWSLAVEEQFYLFWPVLLSFCLVRRGKRFAIGTSGILIVLATCFRVVDAHYHYDMFLLRDFMMLHTRIDTIMFGCFFALCSGSQRFESAFGAIKSFWWVCPLWFLGFGNLLTRFFGLNYRLTWGLSLNGLTIAILILYLVRNPHTWIGRVFNAKPIAYIGVISYSHVSLAADVYLAAEPLLGAPSARHARRSHPASAAQLLLHREASAPLADPLLNSERKNNPRAFHARYDLRGYQEQSLIAKEGSNPSTAILGSK